jgi:hypothetical protein
LLGGGLGFEQEAAIAQGDFDFGGGVLEVGEIAIGDFQNEGVDLVDAESIAGQAVGGEGAMRRTAISRVGSPASSRARTPRTSRAGMREL